MYHLRLLAVICFGRADDCARTVIGSYLVLNDGPTTGYLILYSLENMAVVVCTAGWRQTPPPDSEGSYVRIYEFELE